MRKKKIVYCDPSRQGQQDHFRNGTAVFTSPDIILGIDAAREKEHHISPNLYWGLFNLGIVDGLNTLPLAPGFPIKDFEEGVLLPEGLSEAAKILRTTAATLKSQYPDGVTRSVQQRSFAILWKRLSVRYWVETECRIKIDVPMLKQELCALADFLEAAKKEALAVQLWL